MALDALMNFVENLAFMVGEFYCQSLGLGFSCVDGCAVVTCFQLQQALIRGQFYI